jgi:hypothetical protein
MTSVESCLCEVSGDEIRPAWYLYLEARDPETGVHS